MNSDPNCVCEVSLTGSSSWSANNSRVLKAHHLPSSGPRWWKVAQHMLEKRGSECDSWVTTNVLSVCGIPFTSYSISWSKQICLTLLTKNTCLQFIFHVHCRSLRITIPCTSQLSCSLLVLYCCRDLISLKMSPPSSLHALQFSTEVVWNENTIVRNQLHNCKCTYQYASISDFGLSILNIWPSQRWSQSTSNSLPWRS